MNNYTGRRKYKRIELEKWKYKEIVSPCITRFRATQYDGQETYSLEWNIVAVKNLSAGGIMFNYYKMDLGFGSLLELKLDFIKSKPTISCIGRVVRIEDAHTNSMFRIATEFTEINDLDREIINTTVEAILKREAKKKIYPETLLKMTNTLTRRVGIAEAKFEGSKIKTIPSVHLEDEFWTHTSTAPETLPLEESKMISESVLPALRNGDIDGQEKEAEKLLEPKDVDGISAKNKIQEAKKAECIAELKAEREVKAHEPSGITAANRKAALGKDVYGYHEKSRETTQKGSHAMAYVIAYMVLMLVLGFIVHSDLTKQFNRVETKLDNVISKVDYSGF